MEDKIKDYFEGKKLFGDDFSQEQILKWYEEETEAYANLGSGNSETYSYLYNEMNKIHGFNKIKNQHFNNVLGFGSAYGLEFEPIIKQISELTIIEPSDNLLSDKIGNVVPKYVKPSVSGELPFDNNSFDLITCFGTLHHIPNVSFVLSELIRVLKPNGYLLIREPIISMGDWRNKRPGLTKNERGIPVSIFDSVFKKHPVQIISKEYCFTMIAFLQGILGKFTKKPIFFYRNYVYFDRFLSSLVKNNLHYHAQKKLHRVAPTSIFYVIQKSKPNPIG